MLHVFDQSQFSVSSLGKESRLERAMEFLDSNTYTCLSVDGRAVKGQNMVFSPLFNLHTLSKLTNLFLNSNAHTMKHCE